jgi:nucleoside-diphosphate-sugar epimerase
MKVFIVGSCGYLGKFLERKLIDEGHEVSSLNAESAVGIDIKTGLISTEFILPEGIDVVYYLSQSPFYREMPQKFDHLLAMNNVSAVRVAEECVRQKVKKLIYTSTGNVYEPTFMPHKEAEDVRRDDFYALSKVQAEESLAMFRNYLDVTIVRPFGIYGPEQAGKLVPIIADRLLKGDTIFIDAKEGEVNPEGLRVSLCYIDDVVDMMLELASLNNVAYLNMGGREQVSVLEIARNIGELAGKELKVEVTDRLRTFDLIADISLQEDLFHRELTPFKVGIEKFFKGLGI